MATTTKSVNVRKIFSKQFKFLRHMNMTGQVFPAIAY
jgi:hypothetical protein